MIRRIVIAACLSLAICLGSLLSTSVEAQPFSTFVAGGGLPNGCSNGQVPEWQTSTNHWICGTGGGSSGLTVGTTTITSGTTTRILYDNAGVLGEYSVIPVALGGTNATSASITAFNNITGYTAAGATGTTSTNLVFSTSPALTTPTLSGPIISDGTSIKTDTTTAHTALIQAYDVDGAAYKTFATLTNGNTPNFDISAPSGGTLTSTNMALTTPTVTTSLKGTNAFSIQSSDTSSWIAVPVDGNQTFGIQFAGFAGGIAKSLGKIQIGSNSALDFASGTHIATRILESVHPTNTSTLLFIPLQISPTINYSAGTPGAGSYEALKIAVTETALPTGTNYLIRASAGAAGTTDEFTVTNGGVVVAASTIQAVGGYKSSDGSAGVTGATCSAWKNGLCTSS